MALKEIMHLILSENASLTIIFYSPTAIPL